MPSSTSAARSRRRGRGRPRRRGWRTRPSTTAGLIEWASSIGAGVEARRRRARRPPPCPAARPSAGRRPARARRSRRAARRRGARRGCRSPDAHLAGIGRRCATSTPKPSSPKKMLPMPATSGLHAQHLDLVGVEVEEAALPVELVGAGSSSTRPRRARRRRRRGTRPPPWPLTGEEQVVGVGAARRVAAARAVPAADVDAADHDGVGPRVDRGVDGRLPPRHGTRRRRRVGAGRRRLQRADRAVEARPHLGRHVVAAVDDGRGARRRCRGPRPSPRR